MTEPPRFHRLRRRFYSDRRWFRYLNRLAEKDLPERDLHPYFAFWGGLRYGHHKPEPPEPGVPGMCLLEACRGDCGLPHPGDPNVEAVWEFGRRDPVDYIVPEPVTARFYAADETWVPTKLRYEIRRRRPV